ncbi:TAXI family TRAP transporter solute-binding subunit [Nocardiopsis sp. CNT312]|uniref:TAXI family TRAP transporter solute-binding subunit n=1 Tax=Nocardiopsis sp. CNT312 TaxID=1137268 RepID=UPI0004B8567F|nr:TAXI family TRAP transporter solute-binding subunit [Nocardiopsis sp. CNT312]
MAASVLVVLAVAGSQPPYEEPLRLRVGTGGPGGVYHEYGSGLADAAASSRAATEIVPVETAASVDNNRLIAAGSVDAAFTLADVAALAVSGDPPFDEPLPISALARLYDNHTHLVVRSDSPYDELADLSGATVSLGAEGSGTELTAQRLLDLAELRVAPRGEERGGVSAESGGPRVQAVHLHVSESAQALAEGRVDAFFWSGGLPTRAVADLAARTPIRLIDLSDHVPAMAERHGEYFSDMPVPADTYEGVPAVRTIGVPSLLVVGDGMPAETARELTRLLFESRADLVDVHPVALSLHPRSAIATLPVPLHPGAVEYYRSVKNAYGPPAA